ncbi:unnamed protein product [Rotaria sp. Silwood2]|nr:unnamed protein product [Rotaria sp. Silwood2]
MHFPTTDRAAYTYIGVPEGAYYERIFHLFPSLCVCHLCFWRYIHYTLDTELILPFERTFMSIQTNLLNLQSLVLRQCSSGFLSYLFEHLPQLKKLSFERSAPWLPPNHPLEQGHNKHLAPNLRYLNIKWNECIMTVKSINELFERDVLFSLTNFILVAHVSGPDVLYNLLSMLSSQCLYSFYVNWSVKIVMIPLETNKILSDTFEQLKGPVPIELKLSFEENMYCITAVTLPRMEKYFCVHSYLHNSVHGLSRWSYDKRALNSQFLRCNTIRMSDNYNQINDEFLYLSPPIVPWHQVISLIIAQPFNSIHLHFLFSQLTNLRILELHYQSEYASKINLKEETLIDFLNDAPLCNMLMSNGLRQLNLITFWNQPNLINIAYLIVERLPHLQAILLDSNSNQFIKISHILINGLSKLNFLTIIGCIKYGKLYEKKLRDLQNSIIRSFRTEVPNTTDEDTLFVWL